MTEILPKQTSLQLLRPQSATQLQNEEKLLKLGKLKLRPSTAHANPSDDNSASQTFLTDSTGFLSSDEDSLLTENIKTEILYVAKSRSAGLPPPMKKKKKRKVIEDPRAAIEAWTDKKKLNQESDAIHPFVNISLHGLDNSDEYDTDIEDDFIDPAKNARGDATGLYIYKEKCEKHGLVPVSYVTRNISKRYIRMRHHYIGGDATKPLAQALKVNTITENLDLSDNYLESKGACYIADMMNDNLFIVNLNISNNFIDTVGIEAMSNMLKSNTTLKTLSLAGNQMGDREAVILVEGLKYNDTLQSLDISNNNIGELGGLYLGHFLANNESLCDVDFSWNCIRGKGAASILQALKSNIILEVLDLSWNGVGMEGSVALQKYLPLNTKLRILDLTNNRITSEAAKKLAVGLKKNTVLEAINLNQNAMKDEGVEAILKAVQVNDLLKLVSLENCAEIGLNRNNYNLIQEICNGREIMILHGGTGGYKRPTAITSILNIYCVFLEDTIGEVESMFQHQDKENLGILNSEEIKYCLKDSGLRLTNRQLEMLLVELDKTSTGNISYRDLVDLNIISEHLKRNSSSS